MNLKLELEVHVYLVVLQLRSLSNPSEIAHNEDIMRIFLMACEVRSVKLSVIGLSCLQKLISHNAVAPSALKEILSTLKEVVVSRIYVLSWMFVLLLHNYPLSMVVLFMIIHLPTQL